MAGCMKNALAGVGCVSLLVVGGAIGWQYREQVVGLVRSTRGREAMTPAPTAPSEVSGTPAPAPQVAGDPAGGRPSAPAAPSPAARRPVQDSPASVGNPSAAALRSAQRKQDSMERASGPASVTLSAAEMASLIHEGLGPAGRQALDSLKVGLAPDRLELRAALVTEYLRGALGPFAAMLQAREPMRASGPARVAAAGVVAWEPDSFIVRAFPFPPGFIPPVVDRLTGGRNGVVPIRVPSTVGDVRITPGGVTFYRREER